ncbi:MAG: histidine kinase [Thermoproteus sp.]|nr:histidine kinase [Thermoproteus sp.]
MAKESSILGRPDQSIKEMAEVIANYRVGLAILADSADPSKAVGAVSERDAIKAAASGVDMARPIGEMATGSAASVEAEGRAQGGRARADYVRRAVATRGGRLYGIISIRDLVYKEEAPKALSRC